MNDSEIQDQAAELDTMPAPGTQQIPDDANTPSFSGRCHGGPWDTWNVEIRYPKGFLLVHKPHKACWIYDRRTDGDFYVRSAEPEPLRDFGAKNRWRAADEQHYDIRVLDPEAVAPAGQVKR